MAFVLTGMAIALTLFLGMLLCFKVGRRTAHFTKRSLVEGDTKTTSTIDAAVFGILGLLVTFTFYGAGDRLDSRRGLIVEEANAIGTAFLRTDLLPANLQPEMRDAFRKYLDTRLGFYKSLSNTEEASVELQQSSALQKRIWERSVAGSAATGAHPDAARLLLPALNSMIDITTTRRMAMQMHPPGIIFGMLFGFSLVASLLAGRTSAGTQGTWPAMCIFAGVMAVAVYVTLDLEFPRLGFIRVDSFDQALVEVRARMD